MPALLTARKLLFLLLSISLLGCTQGSKIPEPAGPQIKDFALLDQNGKLMELSRFSHAKAVVLLSYGIGCPIARKLLPKIAALNEKYKAAGIHFFLMDSNLEDTREALKKEAQEFSIALPILMDDTQEIARDLKITRTGEALLLNPSTMRILFRGPIDDRLAYNSRKKEAGENYFEQALGEFLAGKNISQPALPALGCEISFPPLTAFSYTEKVRPILEAKCFSCHVTQGIAPRNLATYRELKGWGNMLKEVIRTERMPPWEVDEGSSEPRHRVQLTAEEKRTIFAWVDGGFPEGPALKEKFVQQKRPTLRRDLTLSMAKPIEISASSKEQWHYELLLKEASEDIWISGYEFLPSNPGALSHMNLFVTKNPLDLSKNEFEPEWNNEQNTPYVMIWASLARLWPLHLEAGRAIKIPKGYHVYLELHFIETGKAEKEFVKVDLQKYSSKPPPVELSYSNIRATSLKIPARAPSHWVSGEMPVTKDTYLSTLAFHMHLRGRSGYLSEISADGSEKVLCILSRYLNKNKAAFTFQNLPMVKAGSKLVAHFEFDNSESNPAKIDFKKEVNWGPSPEDDEMGRLHIWSVSAAPLPRRK